MKFSTTTAEQRWGYYLMEESMLFTNRCCTLMISVDLHSKFEVLEVCIYGHLTHCIDTDGVKKEDK